MILKIFDALHIGLLEVVSVFYYDIRVIDIYNHVVYLSIQGKVKFRLHKATHKAQATRAARERLLEETSSDTLLAASYFVPNIRRRSRVSGDDGNEDVYQVLVKAAP